MVAKSGELNLLHMQTCGLQAVPQGLRRDASLFVEAGWVGSMVAFL